MAEINRDEVDEQQAEAVGESSDSATPVDPEQTMVAEGAPIDDGPTAPDPAVPVSDDAAANDSAVNADEQPADAVDAADAADEAVEPEQVDPYAAFRAELRAKPGKWYVVHSYAGFERRVKQNLENRTVSMNMEDFIFEVQVPMEDVVEIKNGQRKMVTRVRVPSYVMVRMILNEDSWSVVRHTPGVTGFVGNAHNPIPLRFKEVFSMLKSTVEIEPAAPVKGGAGSTKAAARPIPAEVDFEIGETITIKEGSFAGLPGSISEIKPESGKLTVLVSLFERETPVELSFDQVGKL